LQEIVVSHVLSLLVPGSVFAEPIVDESSTSLKVSPTTITPFGDQEFTVTVERVDDLLDDDGGLIAERITDVSLRFEVADDQVKVNGVPVDFGISTVQVESKVNIGRVGMSAGLTAEEVAPAFDIGLVLLKVKAQADKILVDADELAALRENLQGENADEELLSNIDEALAMGGQFEVRRVVVAARILEINGHDVVQTNAVEQVFDILPSGSIYRGQPKTLPSITGMAGLVHTSVFDADELAQQAQQHPCHRGMHHHIGQQFMHHWRQLPEGTRIGIAIFGATFLLLTMFVALPFAIYTRRRLRNNPRYQALERDDESSLDFDIDEKKTGGLADPQLLRPADIDPPAYEEHTKLLSQNASA
jgi:hypothetical protein